LKEKIEKEKRRPVSIVNKNVHGFLEGSLMDVASIIGDL